MRLNLSLNTPDPAPLPFIQNERELNAALKEANPLQIPALIKAYESFSSPRVQILHLENLIELGRWKEARLLGEALLALPAKTPKNRQGKGTGKVRSGFLTESQRHKIFFNLALACEQLGDTASCLFYFAETEKRPHYYYLYRQGQMESRRGNTLRELELLDQSYQRSGGRFAYINNAYGWALVRQALALRRKDPQTARDLLTRILGDENLAKGAAGPRAEILWHQRF